MRWRMQRSRYSREGNKAPRISMNLPPNPHGNVQGIVRDVHHAGFIGHMWAVHRGADAVVFSALARSIFTETPGVCTELIIETSLRHFYNANGDTYRYWAGFAARSWDYQSEWAIETAK